MNGRIHVSLLPLGCSKIGPDVSELYEEAEKQDKEVDVEAMTVTGLPKPERPRLPSERHEMMMQVWEAVRHVGDANGRDRGIGFCRLPPRRARRLRTRGELPRSLRGTAAWTWRHWAERASVLDDGAAQQDRGVAALRHAWPPTRLPRELLAAALRHAGL